MKTINWRHSHSLVLIPYNIPRQVQSMVDNLFIVLRQQYESRSCLQLSLVPIGQLAMSIEYINVQWDEVYNLHIPKSSRLLKVCTCYPLNAMYLHRMGGYLGPLRLDHKLRIFIGYCN